MVLNIRPAAEGDIAGVARVVVDAWRSTFAGRLPADFLDGMLYAQQEQRHRRTFATPDTSYHVATADGAIVGFASGGPTRRPEFSHENELYAIYILPGFQHRNIGSTLFRYVVSDLHQSGRTGLVAVALGLNPYRSFYERLDGVPVNGGTITSGSVVVDQVAYLWEDLSELAVNVVPVTTHEHWQAYHDIRRTVLFEARGLIGYDADHPDDRMPGHTPLLLIHGRTPIGAARLDLMEDGAARVRTVAIKSEHQGNGYGRILMSCLEKIASRHGVKRLVVNAARDAVGFYEALGWAIVDAARDSPMLIKQIANSL